MIREYQDRFYNRKWGVFNHFLNGIQNNPAYKNSKGITTSFDELVHGFNVELLAKNLHQMGAGYYVITIMQGTPHLIAPNATFDEIAGTKPGEACSTRDLVLDISNELKKYDIDLFLYFTGDGPYKDNDIGSKFGFIEPRQVGVTKPFVDKWTKVLEEYAVRYGDRISGWWIDGCYRDFLKYTDELLEPYYLTCKKGNPNALVALNAGVGVSKFGTNFRLEDFTCGEMNVFEHVPERRFYDNAQAHILAPLGADDTGIGATWGSFGLAATKEHIVDYVDRVHAAGGVVTFDIGVYRDGSFDPAQVDALSAIRR